MVTDDFDKNSFRGLVRIGNRLECIEEKVGSKRVETVWQCLKHSAPLEYRLWKLEEKDYNH